MLIIFLQLLHHMIMTHSHGQQNQPSELFLPLRSLSSCAEHFVLWEHHSTQQMHSPAHSKLIDIAIIRQILQ